MYGLLVLQEVVVTEYAEEVSIAYEMEYAIICGALHYKLKTFMVLRVQ